MTRARLASITVATVVAAACGSSGLNHWLYPVPHLEASEEAIIEAYERHGLRSVDGEDAGSRCWTDMNRPEAYRTREVACRLHIRPGEHTLGIQPDMASRKTVLLTFTALPGRIYGLERSDCLASVIAEAGHQQTCRMEMVEIGTVEGGG